MTAIARNYIRIRFIDFDSVVRDLNIAEPFLLSCPVRGKPGEVMYVVNSSIVFEDASEHSSYYMAPTKHQGIPRVSVKTDRQGVRSAEEAQ